MTCVAWERAGIVRDASQAFTHFTGRPSSSEHSSSNFMRVASTSLKLNMRTLARRESSPAFTILINSTAMGAPDNCSSGHTIRSTGRGAPVVFTALAVALCSAVDRPGSEQWIAPNVRRSKKSENEAILGADLDQNHRDIVLASVFTGLLNESLARVLKGVGAHEKFLDGWIFEFSIESV